jgi:hypothetical protein
MSFSLKQLTRLVVRVRYPSEDQGTKKRIHRNLAESLEKSNLKDIKGLNIESSEFRWYLDNAEKAIDSVPIIELAKDRMSFDISRNGFFLRIPRRFETPKHALDKLFTKSVFREASDILNRILLTHAGVSEKSEIETKMTATFVIEPKTRNLGHLIDTKCNEIARKRGYDLCLRTGSFLVKSKEDDREVSHEVSVTFYSEDVSDNLEENQAEWRYTVTTIGPLEGFDLGLNVSSAITTCKQISSILGV